MYDTFTQDGCLYTFTDAYHGYVRSVADLAGGEAWQKSQAADTHVMRGMSAVTEHGGKRWCAQFATSMRCCTSCMALVQLSGRPRKMRRCGACCSCTCRAACKAAIASSFRSTNLTTCTYGDVWRQLGMLIPCWVLAEEGRPGPQARLVCQKSTLKEGREPREGAGGGGGGAARGLRGLAANDAAYDRNT